MSPRGRRIFYICLFSWLIVSPIVWALYQWHSEKQARTPEALATTLTAASTCADWAAATDADRQGWARQEALRRGWEARLASEQVIEQVGSWCRVDTSRALGGFAQVDMVLTPAEDQPGG